MRLAVAVDHRLRDLRLQRQHPLDPLRRAIVALVVDDQVLLAVSNYDSALLVEMADIAGREPSVLQHARGFFVVAPVAVHHVLAADHDLAVLGHPYFASGGRSDRVEPYADAR